MADPKWYEIVTDPAKRLNIEFHELLRGEHCHVWLEEAVNLPLGHGGAVPRGLGERGECVRCGARFDTTRGASRPPDGNSWPDYTDGWSGIGRVVEAMEGLGFVWQIVGDGQGYQAAFELLEGAESKADAEREDDSRPVAVVAAARDALEAASGAGYVWR